MVRVGIGRFDGFIKNKRSKKLRKLRDIRNISKRSKSFLIKKSPIMGAKNIPGDSKNKLETLFLASKIVNFTKR